ncbi:copper chaperone CopZ [soil metagenome]
MALQELKLKITGMTCGHCVKSVENAIKELDGIQSLNVDLNSGQANLLIDNAKVSGENIIAAVNETEVYQASLINQ